MDSAEKDEIYQDFKDKVNIKRTYKDDLTDDQSEHMNKVNGDIARHTAQEPANSRR